MFKFRLLALSLSVMICLPARTQSVAEKLLQWATTELRTALNDSLVAGFAIGVIDHNQSATGYYGFSSIANKKRVDSSTAFEVGSISKTFTALLLAQLVADGSVTLADSIRLLLPPDIAAGLGKAGKINLVSLATHRSGMPRNLIGATGDYTKEVGKGTLPQFYDSLSKIDPTQNEGNKLYSNAGFELLGNVLQSKTGKSYATLLEQGITTKLGMTNTTLYFDRQKQYAATGYQFSADSVQKLSPTVYFYNNFSAASGGVTSTLPDMMKYLSFLLQPSRHTTLSSAAEICLKAYGGDPFFRKNANALAWGRNYDRQVRNIIYDHDGGTSGFTAFILFNQDIQRGVVLLANTKFSGRYYNMFIGALYRILYNKDIK